MAMLGSVGVYVAITLFVASGMPPLMKLTPELSVMLKAILAVISGLNLAVVFFLDKRLRSRDAILATLKGQGFGAFQPGAGEEDEGRRNIVILVAAYFQLCLIKWALVETIAIYGLVLAFVTSETLAPSMFYLAAAVFMANMKPRDSELEEIFRHGGVL